ncbi:MAG: AzlC family ABC transporter permease [Oscillospiraceae bacterium]|nr:AzlC family ABC transporter permease [Oscillospiraceae bacterium]
MEKTIRNQQFKRGMRAGLPVVLGFFPVAVSYAIIARQAGLSTFQIGLMSLTVFAGASQMMAAGMIQQHAGLAAIIIATFILNLRHFIMSTCIYERMQPSSKLPRLLSAYWVTDESFALYTTEKNEDNLTVFFFLGIGLSTYLAWFTGSVLGALLTGFLPELISSSLGIALYAMFAALLTPSLHRNGRLALLVLLTAVCNTLLSRIMDSSWALILSTLLCAFAGVYFVTLGVESDGQ